MRKKKKDEEIKFNLKTGQKLRWLRKNTRISQKELAEYLEVSQHNIVGYENGSISIPFLVIIKICEFFKISTLDYFIEHESLEEEIAYYRINIYDYYSPMAIEFLRKFKDLKSEEKEKREFYEIYHKNPLGIIYLLSFNYYPPETHWSKRQSALKDIYMSGDKIIIDYLNGNITKYLETRNIKIPENLGFGGLSFFLLDKLNEIYSEVNFFLTADFIILNDILDKTYLLYTNIELIKLENDCKYKKYIKQFEFIKEYIATYKINNKDIEVKVKAFKFLHSGYERSIKEILKMDIDEIFAIPIDKFRLDCIQNVHGVEIARDNNNILVMLTELEENKEKGRSVQQMFEDIATIVYNEFLQDVNPKKIKWIEHWQREYTPREQHPYKEVILDFKGKGVFSKEIEFFNPRWQQIEGIISIFAETETYKNYDFSKIEIL